MKEVRVFSWRKRWPWPRRNCRSELKILLALLLCMPTLLLLLSGDPYDQVKFDRALQWSTNHKTLCRSFKCIRSVLSAESEKFDLMKEIVTPFSPWFYADFYIGNELEQYVSVEVLQKLKNYTGLQEAVDCSRIHAFAVLFVQVGYFQQFMRHCLPFLLKHIFLITGQWHGPALGDTIDTRNVLIHPKILHLFTQNPFDSHPKLTAIPYGILDWNLQPFIRALRAAENKTSTIVNLYVSPTHPDRQPLIDLNATKSSPDEYYEKLKASFFVTSPMGDRPDSYRHWEAIGLGTIPICNCPMAYRQLFQDNMKFSSIDDMLTLLKHPAPLARRRFEYGIDRDLISSGYWAEKIKHVMIASSKQQAR